MMCRVALAAWVATAIVTVFSLTLVVIQYAVHEPARVVVTPAVFTSSECESLLAVAKNEGAWSKKRHRYAATDDFLIHTIAALKNVTEAFESRVLPLVRKLHGVPDGVEVSVKELYVIRYLIRSESQRGLDSHIDGSTLSASIALSEVTPPRILVGPACCSISCLHHLLPCSGWIKERWSRTPQSSFMPGFLSKAGNVSSSWASCRLPKTPNCTWAAQ